MALFDECAQLFAGGAKPLFERHGWSFLGGVDAIAVALRALCEIWFAGVEAVLYGDRVDDCLRPLDLGVGCRPDSHRYGVVRWAGDVAVKSCVVEQVVDLDGTGDVAGLTRGVQVDLLSVNEV